LTLEQLEAGEDTGDRSTADYQYVAMLAEQGLTDEQIDERFRSSNRMREKWDEKHRADGATYGQITIENVRKEQATKAKGKNADEAKALTFAMPKMPKGSTREYVIKPAARFSGWFPRGAVSVIGGSSNAGKTSLILDLLVAQERGQKYLGREGSGFSFLWLSADRGEEDNLETLERLGLLDNNGDPTIPLDYIYAGVQGFAAAEQILRKIEKHGAPAVVFVEGADALVEDANKVQIVAPFLTWMRQIAEHYRIAIILSVGAPKAKPGEAHTLKRDRIFGSQIWTRMTSTVMTLAYVGDGTESQRELDISYKNAAPETFALEFNSAGKLVPRVEALEVDALELWARQAEWFTRSTAVDAMEKAEAGMKKTAVYERLAKWLAKGKLEKRYDEGKEELRWKHKDAPADEVAEVF
jgi:primase/DNA polymerase family protein/AAA domain-containing protein